MVVIDKVALLKLEEVLAHRDLTLNLRLIWVVYRMLLTSSTLKAAILIPWRRSLMLLLDRLLKVIKVWLVVKATSPTTNKILEDKVRMNNIQIFWVSFPVELINRLLVPSIHPHRWVLIHPLVNKTKLSLIHKPKLNLNQLRLAPEMDNNSSKDNRIKLMIRVQLFRHPNKANLGSISLTWTSLTH